MRKLLGKILISAGVIGLIGSTTILPGYFGASQGRAQKYLLKNIVPIEQKIKSLETSPLAAISSDDTIPKDFNELVKYYRSLIEQRDALNKTPEVIEAREKAELAPFYCGLAGITSMASLASGIVGYRLSRRKETN